MFQLTFDQNMKINIFSKDCHGNNKPIFNNSIKFHLFTLIFLLNSSTFFDKMPFESEDKMVMNSKLFLIHTNLKEFGLC